MATNAVNNNLNLRYSKGQNLGGISSWLSNTTLSVSSGSFIDSTNEVNIDVGAAVVNGALSGVINGLDTGQLEASTMYYLFAIRNSLIKSSTTHGFLLSTSVTPVLPAGYDTFKLIGFELTDSSSHFVKKTISGEGNLRTHWWDTSISVLSSGAATTLTSVNLQTACPSLDNLSVILSVSHTPNAAGGSVSVAPFGSVATVIPTLSSAVASVSQKGQLEVVSKLDSGVPKILYINSAATGSTNLLVSGFRYSL